jgi:rare lipoprotein A
MRGIAMVAIAVVVTAGAVDLAKAGEGGADRAKAHGRPSLAGQGVPIASWYHEGRRTASGERFRPDGRTAAHRQLPFGSRVRVTNLHNGLAVVVRINDRGPAVRTGAEIDLARGAARAIGMLAAGRVPVRIERL